MAEQSNSNSKLLGSNFGSFSTQRTQKWHKHLIVQSWPFEMSGITWTYIKLKHFAVEGALGQNS